MPRRGPLWNDTRETTRQAARCAKCVRGCAGVWCWPRCVCSDAADWCPEPDDRNPELTNVSTQLTDCNTQI